MVYPNSPNLFRKPHHLVFDAQMYAIADKYDLSDLKRKVGDSFAELLIPYAEGVEFGEAARAIYDLTPETDRGLKDLVKDIVWSTRATMFPRQEIQRCIRESEGFRNDMLQAMFTAPMSVGSTSEKRLLTMPEHVRAEILSKEVQDLKKKMARVVQSTITTGF